MKQYLVCCLVVLLSACVSPLSSVSQPLDEDVLEVKIKGVTIDPQGNTPVVILEEQQGHRAFPIWIGLPEARAIMLEMEGVSTPRPLTHVLLHNILVDLNVKIGRVIITDMQEDTFYATILLRQGNKTLTIDARPSDAIALAFTRPGACFCDKKTAGRCAHCHFARTSRLCFRRQNPWHASPKPRCDAREFFFTWRRQVVSWYPLWKQGVKQSSVACAAVM